MFNPFEVIAIIAVAVALFMALAAYLFVPGTNQDAMYIITACLGYLGAKVERGVAKSSAARKANTNGQTTNGNADTPPPTQ